MKDVTLPNGSIIKAQSYFLIADAGFSTLKDNPSWPNADYEEAMTLANSNAGVALIDANGTIIDAVGWGDAAQIKPGLFEGTPANQVAQGMSLIRVNHSGSNAFDFAESSPDLVNSNGESGGMVGSNATSSGIAFTITVTNPISSITSTFINDENPTENGTQIVPLPKDTKYFEVIINASNPAGKESIGNLSASFNGQNYPFNKTADLNLTSSTFKAEIPVRFYDRPGAYNLTISADDGSGPSQTNQINKSIEIQELDAYEIDAKTLACNVIAGRVCEILGDMDMDSEDMPTIQNIGNAPLNFEVSGQNLVNGNKTINTGFVKYGFGEMALRNVTLVPALNAVMLNPGDSSLIPMNFEVDIPANTTAGNYTTQVIINGASA